MDLEIIEEGKGVGIEDDHNFHRSVCGEGSVGKRDEWFKTCSGESGSHQCPSRNWQDVNWNAMVDAGDSCVGPMTEHMACMDKAYWGDS